MSSQIPPPVRDVKRFCPSCGAGVIRKPEQFADRINCPKCKATVKFPYDCAADADFLMTARDDFTTEQLQAIKRGAEASDNLAGHPVLETDLLLALWEPEYKAPCYSLSDSELSFGMSAQFKKDIACVEKKLQGRILVAIAEILDAPCTPRGDTVKPLTGELRGLWRFRIGDFRLVYRPSADGKTVILVSFASRGSVYAE